MYNAEADLRKYGAALSHVASPESVSSSFGGLTTSETSRKSAKNVIAHLRARVAQLESEMRESRGERRQSSPGSFGTAASSTAPESTESVTDQDLDRVRQGKSVSPTDATVSSAATAAHPQAVVTEPPSTGYNASPPLATSPSDAADTGTFSAQYSGAPGPLYMGNTGFGLDVDDSGAQTFPHLRTANDTQDLPLAEPLEPDLDSLPGTPETENGITDILAARVGALRIAEDGELRYYGPTSNLHVQPNGSQSLSQATIRHVESEGSGVLKQLGLDREIPLSTEMHLARL